MLSNLLYVGSSLMVRLLVWLKGWQKITSIFRRSFLKRSSTATPLQTPIRGIEIYVAVSRELGILLSSGYLFRSIYQLGHVVDKPLLGSTAESRLRKYLKDAQMDAGETLHSFRAGCAITLVLSGSPLADVMSHVGWSSPKTAVYYIKLADVIRAGAPSYFVLQRIFTHQCLEASRFYADFNNLKNFVTAFPLPASPLLKRLPSILILFF